MGEVNVTNCVIALRAINAPDVNVESASTRRKSSLDICDLNVLQDMKSNEVKDVSIQYCPSTVTSTSFTNLPSEAEPEFIELSLGVKAPVTTSNLFIDYSATPISFIPPQDPPKKTTCPTCRDILKKPVHKKKRTNKAKCGQMDTNKQFQIVCWDALATQPMEEPQKKKRKITPKAN
ncbi:hypothetical protein Tco_0491437 [Tanacetum coccineum]